jgi:hypothetical protein
MYTANADHVTLAIQLANEWVKASKLEGNNDGEKFIELRSKGFKQAYDSIIKVIQATPGY